MASHNRNGVEKYSRREEIKAAAARLGGQNGFSKIRVAANVENFHRQDKKLRRNRVGDRQPQGRPRGGRRVRGESGSGFGSVPSRSGREQKTRRLLRRIGLETQLAQARRRQNELGNMTLKPNYLLAFGKTFIWFFVVITVFAGGVPYLQGQKVELGNILGLGALCGAFFGVFVTVAFTPREIIWNDETIKISALFPGSGNFEWRQLEAWGPGRGTFLVKFEGKQAFQIASAGFRSNDWKAFQSLLQQRFPEKRTSFWIGVRPWK